MSINSAKQQMSFLASVLESYEGLVAGKIGNSKLTKEDYDQIDPEKMELIDIRWCLASCIRRAPRYMEITGKQSIGGPSTKLGFDNSKVTYFKCTQKGHFKRECNNSAVDGNEEPFNDDYYRKAIYHRSKEEPPNLKQIENNTKEKSRACVVIQDDEGFDWGEFLPEDDLNDDRFRKTREEILKEKTYRERCIAGYRIEEMEKEYEEAKNYGRYDKKRNCYVNRNGEPVVHKKEIVYEDVLAVIPLFGEFYSNVEKDKHYEKKSNKLTRDVMTVSLRRRDEERMKKNVENLVDKLKKVAEEIKAEQKEVVTKEQQIGEEEMKKKEVEEVKMESSIKVDDADVVDVGEGQKKEEDD
ncbi:putative transcription factor interactor and regulator CCHC(Zn) family [Helianthus annuus]|nr:putative transcription factor interactor and regulator CCHC(Zn) family [Helianthus annuus]